MKRILFAASECAPFLKTGGLADVIGSLPKNIDKEYFDCRVVMPLYTVMEQKWKDILTYRTSFYMDLGQLNLYVGVMECDYEGIHYYFIDNQEYFGGGMAYLGMPQDLGRFAFFCKAALSMLQTVDFRPDIINCHDWQSSLIPVYLHSMFWNNPFYAGIRTVMTVHNMKFQGIWDIPEFQRITGLPKECFTPDKLEYKKDANMLKGGFVYADVISTVSATYAEEIKTAYYGEGLDGLLQARSHDLRGIVDGIDYDVFDPAKDPALAATYDVSNFRTRKKKNKADLQKRLGLAQDPSVMVIGLVSRLTDQKGLDLISCVMDELCQDYVQFAVLGTGDPYYENMFRGFQWNYPGKVSANIYYSEDVAHQIYAGADAFLMPSQFEPCGLSQMMAMRYGTLPIVRETGGLNDTVQAYNEYEKTGTGFSFANYNAHEMMYTVRYAEKIFYDRRRDWNKIVEQAMKTDYSWRASALKYQEMFDWMTGTFS